MFYYQEQKINSQWIKEEITKETFKYLENNENANTTYKILRHAIKAVVRVKFIALNTFI